MLILLILLMMFTTQSFATENNYQFPKGTDSNINGEDVRCYNLDEYKTVAKVFILYRNYKNENELLYNKISELNNINYELKLSVELKNENLKLMSDIYNKDNGFMSKLKTALPWSIIIVESIALSVVSVYASVK
jgi:hypothetical protein